MITLIGHGYVGQHLHQVLPQHRWISHRDPIPAHTTLIINAAGYTGSPNVDQCERERIATFQGNVIFPFNLRAYPTIHISTGCIFQGNKFYTELDTPNFDKSWYSYTKLLSQQLTDHTKDWTLRIRLPFGPQPLS